MAKDSENIDRIKRNYTEATLAHAEQNLGDAPGIVPPSFKLHIQQKAFKANDPGLSGNDQSFQMKEKAGEGQDSGASFVQNFQSRYNTDLSDVKVQKNSKEADAMGTKAFAKGNQVHFATGVYKPDTKEGQQVLGHELVHVLQQRKGQVQATGSINGQRVNEDSHLEGQAHSETHAIRQGSSVNSSLKGAKSSNAGQPVAQGWGFIKKIGKGIKNAAKAVGKGVRKGASAVGGLVSKGAKAVSKGISTGVGFLGKTLGLGGISGKIKNLIGGVRKRVDKGIGWLVGKGKGLFHRAGRGIRKGIGLGRRLLGRIGSGIGRIVRGGTSLVRRGMRGVKKMISKGGKFLKGIVSGSKSLLTTLLRKGMSAARALKHIVIKKLKGGVGNIFKAVGKLASDPIGALKSIVSKVKSGGSKLLGFGKKLGGKILQAAKIVGKKLLKFGGNTLKGLGAAGGSLIATLKSIGLGLGGGVLEMAKGNFKAGLKKMGMGVVEGIMGTLDFIMNSTVGMLDFMVGGAGDGQAVEGKDLPKRAVMDEYCAHRIAYRPEAGLRDGSALTDKDHEIMKQGGYDPDNMVVKYDAESGFQAVLLMPLDPSSGVKPMLAIRGTADKAGALTDLDPQQVGHNQFMKNKGTIAAMIKMAGGKVDVTGHSLGGAMAQITAAHFTSNIGRVTTFQAPGVNKETVKLFSENLKKMRAKGEDGPKVSHHTVKNDLVSKAGQENLPGVTYEHDLGNINPLEAHTGWTSGTADRRADRAAYGMTDEFFNNTLGKEIYDKSSITKYKSNPHKFKRALAESVRALVGLARDGTVNIFNTGKRGVSGAAKLIKKIPGMAKRMSAGAGHLIVKFLKASISKKKSLFKLLSKTMRKIGGISAGIIRNL